MCVCQGYRKRFQWHLGGTFLSRIFYFYFHDVIVLKHFIYTCRHFWSLGGPWGGGARFSVVSRVSWPLGLCHLRCLVTMQPGMVERHPCAPSDTHVYLRPHIPELVTCATPMQRRLGHCLTGQLLVFSSTRQRTAGPFGEPSAICASVFLCLNGQVEERGFATPLTSEVNMT